MQVSNVRIHYTDDIMVTSSRRAGRANENALLKNVAS